jgi:hypothetical protein
MRPDTTTAAVKPSRDRLSAGRRPLQVHFALLIAAFVSVAAAVAVYVHVQAAVAR